MGIAERRERERENVRTRIIEAARDIVSEQGLEALSMRGIAERIEYSPATLYLYFRDKEELLRTVVVEGFERLVAGMRAEIAGLGEDAGPVERYTATGRAYVCFALENTAYFRVMFELPTCAQMECPPPDSGDTPLTREQSWGFVVGLLRSAVQQGLLSVPDVERGALVGWGLVHGLTSLFLAGHLAERVQTREDFLLLIEEAMGGLYSGWRPAGEARGAATARRRGAERKGRREAGAAASGLETSGARRS
ncbi:MAG: TetR/AcrR family transcriptional regulator [Gemmatimonadetes bacterium]|nr:TetR/AcrR family transcriptional regulator [Gemmatimonadota bacterium]